MRGLGTSGDGGAETGVEGVSNGTQKKDCMINKKKLNRGYVLARSKKKCDEKAKGSGLKKN